MLCHPWIAFRWTLIHTFYIFEVPNCWLQSVTNNTLIFLLFEDSFFIWLKYLTNVKFIVHVNTIHVVFVPTDISAYPDSVNVLDGVKNDVRTPDKLVDGLNDSTDGRHMWLAPILPSIVSNDWCCGQWTSDLLYQLVLSFRGLPDETLNWLQTPGTLDNQLALLKKCRLLHSGLSVSRGLGSSLD